MPSFPLLVFNDQWGRHPSSCQHLIKNLTHHPVVWVNTIGMRPPRFDLLTVRRGWGKAKQWLGLSRKSRSGASAPLPNMKVYNPVMWPWFRTGMDRRFNTYLLTRRLRPAIEGFDEQPTAITTFPTMAILVNKLPVKRWVYYCVDDFSEWPGLDRGPLVRMEREVVEKADEIVAVSENLQRRIREFGRESHLLTHGVDVPFWNNPTQALPPTFAGLEKPWVVFWGVIDRRMDLDFLRHLSGKLQRGTIVMIGPHMNPDPAILEMNRVVHLGPHPFEVLPTIARESDVLIMPYADLPVSRAMQPLKLKEYLATGKPVVVRDLPANLPWGDCLNIASNADQFTEEVLKGIEAGISPAQQAARMRIAGESWEAKARQFETYLAGSVN